ncbi:MAG TPA: CopG family transcriptional regulator, partial [Chloroflexota bacterium]|nr:CopG family transcriptional regulator [Chloroflexota bacterium]
HLAVDKGVSLSQFIAALLEERVESSDRYQQARDRQRVMLSEGLDLGTKGEIQWTREELHRR